MFLRRLAPLAVCLTTVISTGCGGDAPGGAPADDKGAVENTVRTYLSALASGNGGRACAQLTGAAQREAVNLSTKTLDLQVGTCADALDNFATKAGAAAADKVCGARADAECKRIASKAATRVLDGTKDAKLRVQVSGDSATASPAAGPEGYSSQLRKVDGKWLISKIRGI